MVLHDQVINTVWVNLRDDCLRKIPVDFIFGIWGLGCLLNTWVNQTRTVHQLACCILSYL